MKRRLTTLTLLALAAAMIATSSACKKKAPTTAQEARPPVTSEKPKESTPVPPPPKAAPVQDEVLSVDLDVLNKKGYLTDAFYDFDKSELRDDARSALATDAQWLKKYPSVQILIEGHCDERGTSAYNLALGDRRANAAKEYLASLGVDASRIRTISYGKERPFCTESTESCWQENRRAHLVITAK
jgi:peptidoglycan-associated lipoprotein